MTEQELREKFALYKSGKHIGRQDMLGIFLDELCELKRRIGAVDEAAVTALNERLAAHELVVGNALMMARPSAPGMHSMPMTEDEKAAAAAWMKSLDISSWVNGETIDVESPPPLAPKRVGWPKGKPRKPAAQEAA